MQRELFAVEEMTDRYGLQPINRDELAICLRAGRRKYWDARNNKRQAGYGPGNGENGPWYFIKGCTCEKIVALKTGLPWDPDTPFAERNNGDVDRLLEVRGITNPKYGLFVKPFDKDFPLRRGDEGKGPMILVLKITKFTYRCCGWMDADYALGHYTHLPAIPGIRDKCVLVPKDDLWPMEYIEIIVRWHKAQDPACGQRGIRPR